MKTKLVKKKKDQPLFNKENSSKSKSDKLYKFAFYRIGYIFAISFIMVFLLFSLPIFFQLRHFIAPSTENLRALVSEAYVATDKFDVIDNQIRKYFSENNIEIISFSSKTCREGSKVSVEEHQIYMCLNKHALIYEYKIITDRTIIFINQLKFFVIMSLLTAISITFLLFMASKRTFKQVVGDYTSKEMLPLINNTLDELNNMILTYNLDKFDEVLDKLHIYSEIFLKTSTQNFYMLESKIKGLMDTAHYHNLNRYGRKVYLMGKELELKYYILTKQYGSVFVNYFLLLTSRHFTSSYQLFIFLSFFCILSGVLLKNLYEIPRNMDENLLFYITQAINVISNLGGELAFDTDVEYIYSIFLQTSGIIVIGILIGVVNKEIK